MKYAMKIVVMAVIEANDRERAMLIAEQEIANLGEITENIEIRAVDAEVVGETE